MNCEPLKKVCKIYNGNSINADFKKKNFAGRKEGYPFIATKDVSFSGSIDYDNGVKIPYDTKFKIAPAGSIFICAEGGSAGRKIARVSEPVCFGNKLFCLVPGDRINSDYLYHYLLSDKFQSQFKFLMSGLIGGVSAKKFGDIFIEFPSPNEQKFIVAKLDAAFAKIDKVIANAADALNEAKTMFAISITEALTPKENWTTDTLKNVSLIYGNYGLGVPSKPYDGECRYLRITDITDWGDLNDELVSADIEETLSQDELQEGDMLFARTGATVGKTLLYHEKYGKCLFAGYLIRYRVNPEIILPKYLFYVAHSDSYYAWVATNQKAAAQPNINAKLYNQYLVSYPDVNEQKKIIAHLDAAFAKVVKLQKNYEAIIDECERFKQSILHNTFE